MKNSPNFVSTCLKVVDTRRYGISEDDAFRVIEESRGPRDEALSKGKEGRTRQE
jgi:hypothetical protein